MEAIKATKFNHLPRKKPTSGLRYDKRTMTLRGYQLTLSCIGKREKLILNVPEHFKEIFETWEFCGGTLTYSKHNKRIREASSSSRPSLHLAKMQYLQTH